MHRPGAHPVSGDTLSSSKEKVLDAAVPGIAGQTSWLLSGMKIEELQ